MSETREVFEMVTKQAEPDLGSWREQERHQRKRAQRRKAGAFVVVAALVVAGGVAFALQGEDPTSGVVDQPTQSPTPGLTSAYIGFVDLTTGATSTIPIAPDASSIDVSPDGSRIAYVESGMVHVADIDGSNVRDLTGSLGDPTGPRWSPDGSSIVYQGKDPGDSIGNLYVVDVGSGKARQITDTAGVETRSLYYMAPSFDPTGRTVVFNMPTDRADQRWDLWSVPATGGELTLVRRDAAFGDYSPDGLRVAFVDVRGDGEFGDLWVVPSAGGKAEMVATGEIAIPRWSPDGTRIAYNDGPRGVYVVDPDTGVQTRVLDSEHMPEWVDDDTLSLTP